MITTQQVGSRTVYLTDQEAEWQDLVKRGQVVYTTGETALFSQSPSVLDEAFRAFLFQAKLILPQTLLIGARA